MLDIPCILFAGGKSSRMGEDKALLPFGDFSTLTEFQLYKLQKIFTNVYISCKDTNKFSFLKKNTQVKCIEDIKTDNIYAPTLGFISSFQFLECEKFFAISVDTPFITKDIINKLVAEDKEDSDATIAMLHNTIQPVCGIYHLSLKDKFENMLVDNNHKLRFLLQNSKATYINFEDTNAFLNLNNKEEYTKALALVNSTLL